MSNVITIIGIIFSFLIITVLAAFVLNIVMEGEDIENNFNNKTPDIKFGNPEIGDNLKEDKINNPVIAPDELSTK